MYLLHYTKSIRISVYLYKLYRIMCIGLLVYSIHIFVNRFPVGALWGADGGHRTYTPPHSYKQTHKHKQILSRTQSYSKLCVCTCPGRIPLQNLRGVASVRNYAASGSRLVVRCCARTELRLHEFYRRRAGDRIK